MISLGDRAIKVVLAHEWNVYFAPDSSWHYVTCFECGAEFANVAPDSPKLKHRDGCEVGAICAEARERGIKP